MTLNEINLDRVPAWIAQYDLWAAHAEGRAVLAIEEGQPGHAKQARDNAAFFAATANYWRGEMVGFASA
jgi:hypothetical protein